MPARVRRESRRSRSVARGQSGRCGVVSVAEMVGSRVDTGHPLRSDRGTIQSDRETWLVDVAATIRLSWQTGATARTDGGTVELVRRRHIDLGRYHGMRCRGMTR